jgi:hypothetical protein
LHKRISGHRRVSQTRCHPRASSTPSAGSQNGEPRLPLALRQ